MSPGGVVPLVGPSRSAVATQSGWIYSWGVYFKVPPRAGGELRIFGVYNNKQTHKQTSRALNGYHYYALLVCILNFSGGLAVWRLYKQTNKLEQAKEKQKENKSLAVGTNPKAILIGKSAASARLREAIA